MIPFDEMMTKIMETGPIEYDDLIKDFRRQKSNSLEYSKRRSFLLSSKEELPKITLSKKISLNFFLILKITKFIKKIVFTFNI